MSKELLLLIAMVLLLAGMPLVSWGAAAGPDALTLAGAALLAIGGLIPPASRYLGADSGDEEEQEQEEQEEEA